MPQFSTPVALIIFNRPDKTARMFAEVRRARPKQLFVIADGPRTEEEKIKTDATRAVTEKVDWECEVQRLYQDKNLGVKKGPPTGISWVFEQVDRCIFLEDDCIPDPSFFRYCEELLEKYKDDKRVMHISGDNFLPYRAPQTGEPSYHFSVIAYLWGWATWRRAWQHYDPSMAAWPEVKKQNALARVLPDPAVHEHWEYVLERYYDGSINSWDGPWALACFMRGLCINPAVNVVTNIGNDADAAHPQKDGDEKTNIPSHPLAFPLAHPGVAVDRTEDVKNFKEVYYINKRAKDRVRSAIKYRTPAFYQLLKRLFNRF